MKKGTIKSLINGNKVVITVKSSLSFTDRAKMIEDIVEMSFDGNQYLSYINEISKIYNILAYYTDIDFNVFGENDSADKLWEFAHNSKVYNKIISSIGDDLSVIFCEAEDGIEFKKAQIIKHSKFDEVADAIVGLLDKLDAMSGNLKDINIKELFDLGNSIKGKSEKKIANAVLDFQELKKATEKEVIK